MSECKPISTPCDPNVKLVKNENEKEKCDRQLPYRELVGSLMYLAVGTRPDLALIVSHLSQFNNSYDSSHWAAAKRVLRYLKGTMDFSLRFDSINMPILGYTDADWGSCVVDRRSYTGYCFLLGRSAISWDSKKQRTVALSTTEAEYMALAEASKEAVYLQRFLNELGADMAENVKLMCDNMSAQKLGKNPVYHSRSKHIDVKHHFVREMLTEGTIKLEYVPTTEMVADILTKALPKQKHEWCVKKLGLASTSRCVAKGSVGKNSSTT